jgi:hypothetical protein
MTSAAGCGAWQLQTGIQKKKLSSILYLWKKKKIMFGSENIILNNKQSRDKSMQ